MLGIGKYKLTEKTFILGNLRVFRHLHFLLLKISKQIQRLQDDGVSCSLFPLAEK